MFQVEGRFHFFVDPYQLLYMANPDLKPLYFHRIIIFHLKPKPFHPVASAMLNCVWRTFPQKKEHAEETSR